MKRELDTTAIIYDALQKGKACYVPVMDTKTVELTMVRIKDVQDFESFEKNDYGILEPSLESIPNRENVLDVNPEFLLVVMPGLAFDKQGGRLGKGKGYYDKFLKRLFSTYEERKLPKPVTIGVALSDQMVDKIPMDENDVFIDDVLFP